MKCPFPDCDKTFESQQDLDERVRVVRHVSAVHGKQGVQKLVEDVCKTRRTCTDDDPSGEVCPCEIFCYGSGSWDGSMRSEK